MEDDDHISKDFSEAPDTGSDSGYLYHQQAPEPRSRRDPGKVRSSHPKASEHNLARDAMTANMKTMGIVLPVW